MLTIPILYSDVHFLKVNFFYRSKRKCTLRFLISFDFNLAVKICPVSITKGKWVKSFFSGQENISLKTQRLSFIGIGAWSGCDPGNESFSLIFRTNTLTDRGHYLTKPSSFKSQVLRINLILRSRVCRWGGTTGPYRFESNFWTRL